MSPGACRNTVYKKDGACARPRWRDGWGWSGVRVAGVTLGGLVAARLILRESVYIFPPVTAFITLRSETPLQPADKMAGRRGP